MARGSSGTVQQGVQILFHSGTAVGLTDRQLLDRIAGLGDPAGAAAFESLVLRHGPMVLRVCQNALPDWNDAQDAFQATFLVLVQRRRELQRLDSLAGWLYGVAGRVSARARVEAARRRETEARAALRVVEAVDPADTANPERDELVAVVQEEVRRLPAKYRAVVVLCGWDGLTHEQAAAYLGCPLGTVRSRLARARDLLHRRLTRRGVAPMAIGVNPIGRMSPPSMDMVKSTVRVAVGVASGRAPETTVSVGVANLLGPILGSMTMIKLGGGVAAGVVVVGLLGYVLGSGAQTSKSSPPAGQAGNPSKAAPPGQQRPPALRKIDSRVDVDTKLLAIVPDHATVKKGDILAELDSSGLRDQLTNQRITVKAAEANFLNARLEREEAERALTDYQNDLFPREAREAKTELAVAELEAAVAKESVDLPATNDLDRKRRRLELARARLAVEKATNRVEVLSRYTQLARIRSLDNAVKRARSTELVKQATLELEKNKEANLARSITACTIRAPIDGTANHTGKLQAGDTVHWGDSLLWLVPASAEHSEASKHQ